VVDFENGEAFWYSADVLHDGDGVYAIEDDDFVLVDEGRRLGASVVFTEVVDDGRMLWDGVDEDFVFLKKAIYNFPGDECITFVYGLEGDPDADDAIQFFVFDCGEVVVLVGPLRIRL
jgi:hypothetical protein